MRRRPSLGGRVSRLALAVIAGWLLVLAAGFDLVLSWRVDQQIEDELRVRAQAASATVEIRDDAIVGVRESSTDGELDSSIWLYAGDRVLDRPQLPAAVLRAVDRLDRTRVHYADAEHRRFYVLPVRSGGRLIGSLVATIDTGPYTKTKRIVVIGSGVVAILLLAGAYPVLRLTASRALRPVDRITRQAAEWGRVAPAERFGAQRFAELDSLASSLDGLLDRLAAVLRHERQLTAELSHELRTPLARMTAEVDLLLAHGAADSGALRSLRAACASMDGIIDTLLVAARTELTRPVGHAELAEVFGPLAGEPAPPRMLVDDAGLGVGVEAELVGRMLAPVVENARRHARSLVELRAAAVPGGVTVTVRDDGPGLPAELAEQVFVPGYTTSVGGAGLGLALARRLARAADGELTVDVGAARTSFVLRLPAG